MCVWCVVAQGGGEDLDQEEEEEETLSSEEELLCVYEVEACLQTPEDPD